MRLPLYVYTPRSAALLACIAIIFGGLTLWLSRPVSAQLSEGAERSILRLRLTWWSDPASSAAIGWEQPSGGAELRYDERSYWLEHKRLRFKVSAQLPSREGEAYWAQLTGLKPDTAYQFEIHSERGARSGLWFVTAPDQPKAITLIAGGDSRNHREVRREANRLVAQLSPTAVLFGGDFTAQDTKRQWRKWLDDWQLSISADGRLTPLIPTRGNHDSEQGLERAWGRAHPRFYYTTALGGDLLRVYTLNSERPAGGEQLKWLSAELKADEGVALKIAQYHKPMRPHTGMKMEGFDEYEHWSPLFAAHELDLAIECDSHLMKVTWPLKPDPDGSQGFKRVSHGGTVFIGEGGWGAPLRSVSDLKPWTMKSGRINHIFFIEITAEGDYALRVLEVGSQGPDPKSPWRSFMWRRAPNRRLNPPHP